jgi:hypothetical protein
LHRCRHQHNQYHGIGGLDQFDCSSQHRPRAVRAVVGKTTRAYSPLAARRKHPAAPHQDTAVDGSTRSRCSPSRPGLARASASQPAALKRGRAGSSETSTSRPDRPAAPTFVVTIRPTVTERSVAPPVVVGPHPVAALGPI